MNILIVDDQPAARGLLVEILAALPDLTLHEAASLEEARAVYRGHPLDAALIDLRLTQDARNRDGLQLVSEIREHTRAAPIVVTAYSEMTEIRAAMQRGAYDYLLKDELCEELVVPAIERLRRSRALEREVGELRARCGADSFAPGLVGTSSVMAQMRGAIRRVALSDRPVLVLGPTGAGKELVVSALHALGPHPDEPLLDINCGALPETLIEGQLFGHEKGAFTGAERRQPGYLSAVGQGTLFLDEIAELPLLLQSKLLRVLESRRFRPVGATAEVLFQGRVVAATHADLKERVDKGSFRQDLYYRLNVLPLRVPALEEHPEDIPALVAHFLKDQGRPLRFTQEALGVLVQSRWPGNVRQLRNLVDRLAVFAEQDEITPAALAPFLEHPAEPPDATLRRVARVVLQLPVPDKLLAIEEALMMEALASRGSKTAAAELLGVHRKVVERRLHKHGDPDPGY